jgi:NAD(P)-dependent dehydrogenase (short-subunit alcohol dehydrogenase family)
VSPKTQSTDKEYVIVWGASGGSGLEVTKRLSSAGKNVLAYVRNTDDMQSENLADAVEVRKFVIEEAFYRKEAARLASEGYKITGMVDCVGSVPAAPDTSLTQRLDAFMKPNLYHQYFAALIFKELLQPGASVVFISSIRALTGVNNPTIEYAFAKAALENLTKSLMYTFAEQRIRVNCIRPTPIADTKISKKWPEALVADLTSQSVYKELLSPADIADVAEFLLSDQSKSITGAIIDTNKGFGLLK